MKTLSRVTVTAPSHLADIIANFLERDAVAVSILAPPRVSEARIEALYSEAPDRQAMTVGLSLLAAVHREANLVIEIAPLAATDWVKKVAGDFPPFPLARWVIYGSHFKNQISPSRNALQIDATNAFGTGEHPTTKGCLLMLDHLLKSHKFRNMLDIGTGSGILAMAFAKARLRPALAIESDALSVRVARENVVINGLQNFVSLRLGKGYTPKDVPRRAPFDLIMANIFASPLISMAKDLATHLKPGGYAILAGLLNIQANSVISAHRAKGIFLVKRMVIGEWSILAMHRRKSAK